jgi:NAD(P)-dependent dehydrogenase (short-subunit alcohol dehydrogenase family)
MAQQLAGKTALVTGGTTGIGLAAAQRFAAEGAHVFVTGRRQDQLDQAVALIGPAATGIRSDITVDDDLDRVFAAVAERGRGLDVLLANAGGGVSARSASSRPSTSPRPSGATWSGRCSPSRRPCRCSTREPASC